jgi:hypothetical protein
MSQHFPTSAPLLAISPLERESQWKSASKDLKRIRSFYEKGKLTGPLNRKNREIWQQESKSHEMAMFFKTAELAFPC